MRAGSNTIFAVLFVAACALPLVGLVRPGLDPAPDLNEKRELTPAPDLGALPLAELPDATEAWFDDHFGFRRLLVGLNGLFRYLAFNTSGSRQVLPGRDGWLFYDSSGVRGGAPRGNHMGELPPQHHKLFRLLKEQFEHNDAWFAARGITYVVVIVPDKWSVYPELLPGSVTGAPEMTSGDLLLDYLRAESDLKLIDLKPLLRELRWEYGPLYHRLDSHWNELGAWLAAGEVRRRLRRWDPRVTPLAPAVPEVTWQTRSTGDLAALMGMEGWLREEEPVVPSGLRPSLKVTELPPPAYGIERRFPLDVTQERSGLPRLLVLRDSFGDALWPFLSGGFSGARWVWTSNIRRTNPTPLVDEFQPDIVIEQRVEKYLMYPVRYFTAPGKSAVVAPHRRKGG